MTMRIEPPENRNQPHRRYNALTGDWILVSPHRTERPWQGRVEPLAKTHAPEYDPKVILTAELVEEFLKRAKVAA